jgi:hypothetical protein
MTDWKSMEDAPKDGRPVPLWAKLKIAPAEKEIQPFGFYYCPFFHVGRLGDEFCNTFRVNADMTI